MKRPQKQEPEAPDAGALTGTDLKTRIAQVDAFYAGIHDPTERLTIAAYEGDAGHARKAIADGGNVNAVHKETGLPVIHLAASGGFGEIVNALLENSACDLTARDPVGRLPSDCAAYGAQDMELAELLAEAEGRQFRDKGKDPRRVITGEAPQ